MKELPRGEYQQSDCQNLLETLDDHEPGKVLIAARSTKQIIRLISESDFCAQLQVRGYNWMVITSKSGAIINGQKVTREQFFNTLKQGRDDKNLFVFTILFSLKVSMSRVWMPCCLCVTWTTLVSPSLSGV